ncbi:hypothetical protein H4582DRAFT_2024809 [Lactarius indigo]|nr:hypothetical protein H4582DRAFT_2024809 [Lactarius indigo]
MVQLSERDKKVVRRWWKSAKNSIYDEGSDNGFTLDNYNPSLTPSNLPGTYRSFEEILKAMTNPISARAKSNRDGSLVELIVSQTGAKIAGVEAPTYIQVNNCGPYTIAVIPVVPQRRASSVRTGSMRHGPAISSSDGYLLCTVMQQRYS